MTIWNIQRTIPTRKRGSHRNDKNRRKNKHRCINIESDQIIQHKTKNKKCNRRLEDFCENTSINNQLQLIATIF